MTICIAAACEGKYVVVATDRMLTVGLPNIEVESDFAKANEIATNCLAATAGSALAHTPIFRDVRVGVMQEATKSIDRIAELMRTAYVAARNKKVEEEVLFPLGLDILSWQKAPAQLLGPLVQNMSRVKYGLWILLAGVDENGPHIYRIENPGKTTNFDPIGYHAIGSGDLHALSTFILSGQGLKTPLQRGLAIAFEAKKRSEKATGVGEQTDMYVVTKDRVTHLPENAIAQLNDVYQKRLEQERKVVSEVESVISKLDILKYVECPT